jgi:hypothetical protein
MKAILLFLALTLCTTGYALPPLEPLNLRDLIRENNEWVNQGLPVGMASYSGSMEPYLKGGETLLCEPFDRQRLETGMLIMFARWDAPRVIHEVIEVNTKNNWFKAKGLSCAYADGWLPPERCKMIVRRVLVRQEIVR